MNFRGLLAATGCIASISLAVAGCGPGGSNREFGVIKGKVTLDGNPIPGGRVIFDHVEGPMAAADIAPDGSFSASVAVGLNRIAVDFREQGASEEKGARSGVRGQEIIPLESFVPEKYVSSTTSGLEYNVVSGDNAHDIALVQE